MGKGGWSEDLIQCIYKTFFIITSPKEAFKTLFSLLALPREILIPQICYISSYAVCVSVLYTLKGRGFLVPNPGPIFALLGVTLLLFRRCDHSMYSLGLEGEKRPLIGSSTTGVPHQWGPLMENSIERKAALPFWKAQFYKVISFRKREEIGCHLLRQRRGGRAVHPTLVNRNGACSPWEFYVTEICTLWIVQRRLGLAASKFPSSTVWVVKRRHTSLAIIM